jgi:nucleoid DNA-binding protein
VKLKELSEGVAKTCDLQPRSVLKTQMETFRQLRVAIEGGERVGIPGFGIFYLRETAAEDGKPAEKTIRFKARAEQADRAGKNKGERADKVGKKKDERADRVEKRKAARAKDAKGEPETAQ